MFVVLESKKTEPLRRDLSMSKDMRDWLQRTRNMVNPILNHPKY